MFGKRNKTTQNYTAKDIALNLGELASQIMSTSVKLLELEKEIAKTTDVKKKNKIVEEIKNLKKTLKIYKQKEDQLKEVEKDFLVVNHGKKFNLDV